METAAAGAWVEASDAYGSLLARRPADASAKNDHTRSSTDVKQVAQTWSNRRPC